jgi:hypothetical protein
MFSIARYAWLVPAALCFGCGDRQPPQWPAAAALAAVEVTGKTVVLQWPGATDNRALLRYQLSRDGEPVAEIPVEDEPSLTVAYLAEFTEYTFDIVAVDEAGNTSPPLSTTVRTADVSPPVWAEGCELAAVPVEPEDITAGLAISWCAATDNDRLDRFELRRGSLETITFPPDVTQTEKSVGPLDGRYVIAACDPSDNCAELPAVQISAESRARVEAIRAEISSSLLAMLGSSDTSNLFVDSGLWEDSAFDSMDFSGISGVAMDAEGLGGLGSRGYGGGGGGGGAAVGVGRLATRGSSTYKAPSASLKPGGQADLAAHVAKRMSRIDHCYSQARAEARDLKGTLTIRLTADADGTLTIDGVSGPDQGGLTSCVTGSLRGRLAEPPGEAVSGTFSVVLDPGSS